MKKMVIAVVILTLGLLPAFADATSRDELRAAIDQQLEDYPRAHITLDWWMTKRHNLDYLPFQHGNSISGSDIRKLKKEYAARGYILQHRSYRQNPEFCRCGGIIVMPDPARQINVKGEVIKR